MGSVRIIGGHWRGRRLHFSSQAALRPSTDRCRETLFNWLEGHLSGRRLLDLFAGSGVLGFEAASRAAKQVVLVERNARTAATLERHKNMLDATQVAVVHARAERYLCHVESHFDGVFLDPPFADREPTRWLDKLIGRGVLRPGSWVALEQPRQRSPAPSLHWRSWRSARIGGVFLQLLEYQPDGGLIGDV